MSTNFDFLKKIDNDLYNIINDAEKLYRDEYFEQCMTQTRRFGEIICKNVLGNKRTTEITFDSMLATLKDCSLGGNIQEKEFIEDLYFLKKHGNEAVHSFKIKQDGTEALECLKRAFEIAISYCTYSQGVSKDILNLQYDIELLITGKKSKNSLSEKYMKAKKEIQKTNKNKIHKNQPQYCSVKSEKRKNNNIFWVIVIISGMISLLLLLFLALI